MVKKIAFVFPGQGSQSVGMGKDLYENFEAAKNVFDTADKVLGKSITTICFEGPEDDLKLTVNTQPSIVTMSIAALESFKSELDVEVSATAGHSLGEYCAMYASGVMDLETTLKAIQKRADLMSLHCVKDDRIPTESSKQLQLSAPIIENHPTHSKIPAAIRQKA